MRETVMSIDMAAKKAGIRLERDVPVLGQRRARDWSTLIGMARKLESEEAARDRERTDRIERMAQEIRDLTRENVRLSAELAKMQLKERARQIELAPKDTHFLLTGEKDGV